MLQIHFNLVAIIVKKKQQKKVRFIFWSWVNSESIRIPFSSVISVFSSVEIRNTHQGSLLIDVNRKITQNMFYSETYGTGQTGIDY